MAKAYLVGSGIAALAAATFLIRDGGFDGGDIHLFEQQESTGGSLDAGGTPEAGYTMRGGRMFETEFRCTYDLLSTIPTLDDPSVSVTEDILAAYEEFGWDDAARLVDADGKITDVRSMGFSERDRLELVKCLATPEGMLDGRKITDCFGEHFFTTNFWYMWCTTFAFQPWHSAIEFRRYLKRFIHLFPSFASMTGIQRTRYNQYDSIVRPLQAWLAEQGVTVHTGCSVTDLDLAPGPGTRVEGIRLDRHGRHERIHVAPQDLVLITNGSMTDSSSLGSHTTAPPPHPRRSDAWLLWHRLARGRDDFGNPDAFDKNIPASQWESFTVTATDPSFLDALEKFSGRETGKGGLMTFTASNWLLTIVANHQPVYRDQPDGVTVWWGYQLAASFRISVGTAHAYVTTVVDHLADKAPGLLKVLRETDPDYVLVDGTLAECDRVGDGRADYSTKHKRHGVNVQVITDPDGRTLWLSPALPGRTHDLTAARTHKIIKICERQGVPVLADMADIGTGEWVTTPKRRPAHGELTPTEQTVNRALAAARIPVERVIARLKCSRIFRHARCSRTA